MKNSILIVHFGDVAAFPPVIHAVEQLARNGYQIDLLSLQSSDNFAPQYPADFQATRHLLPAMPNGWRKLLHWLAFVARAGRLALRKRPAWIYASDMRGLLAACCARALAGSRMLYQEHDSPDPPPLSDKPKITLQQRLISALRKRVLRRADLVLLPNEDRLRIARAEAGLGRGRDMVLWNTAPLHELQGARTANPRQSLRLHFHGSMTPARVPMALIEALALVPDVSFQFASYEFRGPVHTNALLARAEALGIADRVVFLGAIEDRAALIAATRQADIGLAFFSTSRRNINHYFMAGASNKVFDYMGAGLALLLSEGEQWQEYLPHYGQCVNSSDAQAIARALTGWLSGELNAAAQGELGRQKIASDWHFEKCYVPVLQAMQDIQSTRR
jgi:glycosyltransferase involved in cell wall biosynthesis